MSSSLVHLISNLSSTLPLPKEKGCCQEIAQKFDFPEEVEERGSNLGINNSKLNDEKRESRSLNDDSGGNLDVMVIWTSKAECKNYNLPEGCSLSNQSKAAMDALITLAIEETNMAFELSGVETRLFLAHSYRHPTFVENSIDESLSALRNGGTSTESDDGISGIKENRERYGADLVAMIIHDYEFCGTGYIGPAIDYMYSVSSWDCSTGYFSFGHEIGHNLGLRHDRGSEDKCDNLKVHYGYRDPLAKFRTIMAYGCVSGECDNNPGGGCTRIQRYSNSNPDHGWNGLPAGNESNDNAWKINKVKSKVAAYFTHGGTSTPPTLSPSPSCVDSPLEFKFEKTDKSCESVETENLCSNPDVQSFCPATCRVCNSNVLSLDPTLQFTFYHNNKGKTMTKTCEMIANNPAVRCAFVGITETCRATCSGINS